MTTANSPRDRSVDAGAVRREGAVAHIHQELALCANLSVAENILLGREPASHGWLQRDILFDRASRLLEDFGRGEIDPRSRTGRLSLPDQQVVEIRPGSPEAGVLPVRKIGKLSSRLPRPPS